MVDLSSGLKTKPGSVILSLDSEIRCPVMLGYFKFFITCLQKKSTSTISSCELPANEEWKPLPEDFENDESPSEQLLATLPTIGDGKRISKFYPLFFDFHCITNF